jgi:hypothetical protein
MTKDLARPIKLFTSVTKAVEQKASLFGKDIFMKGRLGLLRQGSVACIVNILRS